ncbi:carbohydrate ABC transporter permease [Oceanivirga miroungae]|uniref:Binding-protein-dependent transport system inner membrane protein n=1 Tax=Oceanivirga miroungae TaxID=1130046 RepID=A0A6I8MC54_9FUSO|nr:carbohydrate ABC transporter permease [Oceanivirga miroungae]VWL85018.1 binding-protein-dependent transport system inner membrane protein [Oceanivirga miroungae]
MRKDKLYKAFIYLVLVVFTLSILVPIMWVFMASIKQNSEFMGNPFSIPKSFYFKNFIDAFIKAKMGVYFLNSVIVTAMALFLLVITAVPAAYVLARFEFRGVNVLKSFVKAGMFINVSYIVIPIFLLLLKGDKFLNSLHLIKGAFFLNNLFVLALVYASTSLPFTIYILTGFFETLSKSYEEAAYIDGAGYFTTMIKVMAPLARPSIITIILFNFMEFWNDYIIALTLMTDNSRTLPVGLLSLMASSREAANYGVLYAGMVIAMLPILILYIAVQNKITQGMALGGSKE